VALRSLVCDALLRNDLGAAESYSNQLLSGPQAAFEDQLRHLSILHQERSAQFQPFLQAAQDRAASSAREVYSVASWMTANGMAEATLHWLTNLPAKLQATMPVPLAIGDALVAQRDWPRLENLLAGKNWEQLDFVRLAWLTRAAWEKKRTQAAEAHWRLALRQAEDRLGPLTWLLSMAKQSGQPPDQVLWRIVRKFPKERWAWLELHRFYAAAGTTSGLNLLYSELATYEPNNFVAKNNFAATSMLLNKNLAKAHETARELYTQNPDDSVMASTYAFSQHLQGHTREGLAALEKFPATALETPVLALYYGVLLAADGQTNRATKFLELAQTSALLPEERNLARLAGR
jgi:hypothetical protein